MKTLLISTAIALTIASPALSSEVGSGFDNFHGHRDTTSHKVIESTTVTDFFTTRTETGSDHGQTFSLKIDTNFDKAGDLKVNRHGENIGIWANSGFNQFGITGSSNVSNSAYHEFSRQKGQNVTVEKTVENTGVWGAVLTGETYAY